jgi:hypothetical protein
MLLRVVVLVISETCNLEKEEAWNHRVDVTEGIVECGSCEEDDRFRELGISPVFFRES